MESFQGKEQVLEIGGRRQELYICVPGKERPRRHTDTMRTNTTCAYTFATVASNLYKGTIDRRETNGKRTSEDEPECLDLGGPAETFRGCTQH